jgi:hypothetical protein
MPTPPALPLIFGNHQAQYPVTRRIKFNTRVDVAANGAEQRFVDNNPLFSFSFPFNSMTYTDEQSLLTFFNARLGMFETDWTAILGTQTYANLTFESDTFQMMRSDPLTYELSLNFKQTQNLGYPLGTPTGFPVLTSGLPFQRPYSMSYRNLTVAGDSPTGTRYTYAFRNAGVSGFPPGVLHGWKLSYPVLSDADTAIIEAFFVASQGRYQTFTFLDDAVPTPNSYGFCRFGEDELALIYRGPNWTECSFSVVEFSNLW